MRILIALAVIAGFAAPAAATSAYMLGPTISTSTGKVAQSWAGSLKVAASSTTISTPTITLDGTTGITGYGTLNSAVSIRSLSTGGAGTIAAPWVGWESLAVSSGTTYIFEQGVFGYTVSPNWALNRVKLIGIGAPVLRYYGTGNAIIFDAGAADVQDIVVDNLIVHGNHTEASAGNDALYISGVHRPLVKNFVGYNVKGAIVELRGSVGARMEDVSAPSNQKNTGPNVSYNFSSSTGLYLYSSQAGTYINIMTEGVKNSGIKLSHGANGNRFYGGFSEGNGFGTGTYPSQIVQGVGRGIDLDSSTSDDTFEGMDLENNQFEDITSSGSNHAFTNCTGASGTSGLNGIHFSSGTGQNIIGGVYGTILIDTDSTKNNIIGASYNLLTTTNSISQTSVRSSVVLGAYSDEEKYGSLTIDKSLYVTGAASQVKIGTITISGVTSPPQSWGLCIVGGSLGHCTSVIAANGSCTCVSP